MPCRDQVGVKNAIFDFLDCDTDERTGPIAHELATDEQPTVRLCPYNNEPLPGGFVRRTLSNNQIEINIRWDRRIPLALYQGCANVSGQVEWFDGTVLSWVDGTVTGDEGSDMHEVPLTIVFQNYDLLLGEGTIDTTAEPG